MMIYSCCNEIFNRNEIVEDSRIEFESHGNGAYNVIRNNTGGAYLYKNDFDPPLSSVFRSSVVPLYRGLKLDVKSTSSDFHVSPS